MPNKIGVKDIAREVGCSPTTVSQAFHHPRLVNEQTRHEIFKACERLGYVRRRPGKKRKRVIGITGVSHGLILGEYYANVVSSVLSSAKDLGVNVIIERFGEKDDVLPAMFLKKLLDGVLVLGKISQESALMIKQSGLPLVLCGYPLPQLDLNAVMSDGRAGMYAITRHLVQLGHKNIVYLTGGPRFDPVTSDRLDGFRYALNEAGVKLSEVNICVGDFFDLGSAVRAVEKINKLDKRPSALICESDALAYAANQAFIGAGYRVPEDISITGFDNLPVPYYINVKPKLTTVDVNLDELGRIAFNALLDVIEDPGRAPCRFTMPVRLLVQETTGPAV